MDKIYPFSNELAFITVGSCQEFFLIFWAIVISDRTFMFIKARVAIFLLFLRLSVRANVI